MMEKPASAPTLSGNSTAEDRADYIVARLEQFIREGRKDEQGMSFDKWKQMARSEIAIAVAEAEMSQKHDELHSKRVLFVAASSMITIGFWGTVTSLDKLDYLIGAVICGLAGVLLLLAVGDWRFRSWEERRQAKKRREILGRIESLNRRIKRLEKELEKEAEDYDDLLKKIRKRSGAI
ncbi:MAG: hypothetical protein KAH44_24130 [Oricola sp.]|nr:hypothetical protein [Oricola sp.]